MTLLNSATPEADNAVFTSYSANAEDVMLRRVFRDRPAGFFVDVGAAHPRDENDTYALYERGWRGINVEPNPVFHAALQAERPQDLNLNIVLSDTEGEAVWYDVQGTGLSTCDQDMARQHEERGHEVQERVVRSSTLALVLERRLEQTEVDLLKVDVEGFEPQVLAGNDWRRFRPKLIVVEATWPESPARRETGVPGFLAERGYRRVWFDGLNDFYAEDGFDCGDAFAAPVNVFDRFVPISSVELRRSAERAAEYARSLEQAREQERVHEAAQALDHARRIEQIERDATAQAQRAAAAIAQLQEEIAALQAAGRQAGEALEEQRRLVALHCEAEARLSRELAAAQEQGAASVHRARTQLELVLQLAARLVGGRKVTTAELTRLGAEQNGGEDAMDQSSGIAAGEQSLALPSAAEVALRLVTARARQLEDEVARLQQDIEDFRGENARLRASAEQMRAEILSLSRAVEPMHAMQEELHALRLAAQASAQEVERLRGRNSHEHGDALRAVQQQREHLERTVAVILSSTSWKLSRPYRMLGAGLKAVLGKGRKP